MTLFADRAFLRQAVTAADHVYQKKQELKSTKEREEEGEGEGE